MVLDSSNGIKANGTSGRPTTVVVIITNGDLAVNHRTGSTAHIPRRFRYPWRVDFDAPAPSIRP